MTFQPIIKLGEAQVIHSHNILTVEQVFANEEILERFTKLAKDLKAIAPKADDFLYFSAIFMHSAEAALLDSEGKLRKDAKGEPLKAEWVKKGRSWKWVCSDEGIKPFKNANGDIFPESELIKAHKKWIGRPLCLDHKSSSVDMVRGIIVDTYYDFPNKRIVGLCALDKKNYPDLARKVSTGYSNSVSMGTAVQEAICYDCGQVAVCEADFCNCMKTKKCYGEINVGLNPIELSIVVTGADPYARIRHIVAAVDAQAQYLTMKQGEFAKMAEDETQDIALATKIQEGIAAALKELESVQSDISKLKDNEEKEQQKQESTDSSKEEESHAADNKVQASLDLLDAKLEKISDKVNKLELNEDTRMVVKQSYFQGGGDVNEPTPGKPKYPKEEADSIRNTQDKQMVGQMNTGPVDGMHPGYASFGEGEEARKKRLLRAEEREQRKLRRFALLENMQKSSYFQGGGDVNEPTPGKPKYPKEDADKIREKEDKQMVGQSPFPGVGAVDGLHPSPESADVSDELKRKQMLARAKLSASFKQAAHADGSHDKAKSRWTVEADGKLVLTATVQDIVGDKVEVLYDSVANKDFGRKLLTMVKMDGIEKVAAQFSKKAQAEPPAPGAPEVPAAPPASDPMAGLTPSMEDKPEGGVGNGDMATSLPEVLDSLEEHHKEIGNDLADVRKAVDAMEDKSGNELADLEPAAAGGELPPSMASQLSMQKKLHKALGISFKQAKAELSSLLTELKLAQAVCQEAKTNKNIDTKFLKSLAAEALSEADQAHGQIRNLKVAFVKYCQGRELLVKQAKKHLELNVKTAQTKPELHDPLDTYHPPTPAPKPVGSTFTAPKPKPAPVSTMTDKEKFEKMTPEQRVAEIERLKKTRDRSGVEQILEQTVVPSQHQKQQYSQPAAHLPSGQNMADDMDATAIEDEKDDNDLKVAPDGSMEGSADEVGKAMKAKEAAFDLNTKEGRAAWRMALADKGFQYSDMLKTHKGGFTTKLDTKPSGDLAKVETLEEVQKVMLEVAKAPPKVRQAAEEIQKLVVAGEINPATDFDGLIAEGLDKDAVGYWKQFWGQAKDGGSQFATELVKERQNKKAAEEAEAYRVKLTRAYELTQEMVRRGSCADERHAFAAQVNELMNYNDSAFESFKRIVERTPVMKTASFPQVGMMGVPEAYLPPPASQSDDLAAQLSRAFSSNKVRNF